MNKWLLGCVFSLWKFFCQSLLEGSIDKFTRTADEIDEGSESAVQVGANLALLFSSGFEASFTTVMPVHGIDNL